MNIGFQHDCHLLDLIFEHEFALFQAAQGQLIHSGIMLQTLEGDVEVAMLLAQGRQA